MSEQPEVIGIPNRPFPLQRILIGLLSLAGVFIALALFLPMPAQAKDAIGLTVAQTKQVHELERYLNAITTMRSRFMQVTSQGTFNQGDFMMARPGRMRIEYDPPSPIVLVSDGFWMMYKDKELDQRSFTLLSNVPASIFLGEKVDFFDDSLLISDYVSKSHVIRITLQRNDDPMGGSLTLVFAAKPLALKQWNIVDGQGISTTVSLMGPQFGVPLDPSLFKVENKPLKKAH